MEESNKNKIEFSFKHTKIAVNNFSFHSGEFEEKNPKKRKVNFNFGLQTFLDGENNRMKLDFQIECNVDKNNFAKLSTSFIYEIINAANFKDNDGNNFDIPDKPLRSLVGMSISMAKGIWFEKTLGTNLNIVLPVLDPRTFTKANRQDTKIQNQ